MRLNLYATACIFIIQIHVQVTYNQQIKRKLDMISTNSAIFISFSNCYTSKAWII